MCGILVVSCEGQSQRDGALQDNIARSHGSQALVHGYIWAGLGVVRLTGGEAWGVVICIESQDSKRAIIQCSLSCRIPCRFIVFDLL